MKVSATPTIAALARRRKKMAVGHQAATVASPSLTKKVKEGLDK